MPALLLMVRSLDGANEIHLPVDLPGLTAVGRECLLPVQRIGSLTGPDEADSDRAAVDRVVGEEGTDPVDEAPDHRSIDQMRRAPVEPPDGPRSLLRIERPHGDGAVLAARFAQQVVFDVAQAAEDRSRRHRAVALAPP